MDAVADQGKVIVSVDFWISVGCAYRLSGTACAAHRMMGSGVNADTKCVGCRLLGDAASDVPAWRKRPASRGTGFCSAPVREMAGIAWGPGRAGRYVRASAGCQPSRGLGNARCYRRRPRQVGSTVGRASAQWSAITRPRAAWRWRACSCLYMGRLLCRSGPSARSATTCRSTFRAFPAPDHCQCPS